MLHQMKGPGCARLADSIPVSLQSSSLRPVHTPSPHQYRHPGSVAAAPQLCHHLGYLGVGSSGIKHLGGGAAHWRRTRRLTARVEKTSLVVFEE